jgi:EmrB/QacA subfamily drug resistance transporter
MVPGAMGAPGRGGQQVRVGWILVATCGSALLVSANTSVVTAAIPQIGLALNASQTSLQWVGDAYSLVLAGLLLPCGALVDRFGRKRGLVLGTMIMLVSLLWSGVSGSAGELIASRALAGVGAALMFPGTLATITNVVPADRRGRAVGMWAASFAFGGAVGTMLSGVTIEFFWWGSAFLPTAVLVAGCLILILVAVPETRDPEHSNLDPLGALLSCLAVGAFVLAMTEAPVHGWTSGVTLGGAAVGVVAAFDFLLWQSTNPRPLLNLRLFRNRAFSTGLAAISINFFAGFGWFFLTFQYETYVLGYGPIKAALGLMAGGSTVVPASAMSTTVAARFGRRATITVGLAITAGAAVVQAAVGHYSAFLPIGIGFFLMGMGVGLANGPPTEAVIEALPAADHGVASALNDTAREFGAAMGIAILGSAFNAGYRSGIRHLASGLPASVAAAVRSSPAAGLNAVRRHLTGGSGIGVVHTGVIAGWVAALITTAVIAALGSILVFVRFPSHARDQAAES